MRDIFQPTTLQISSAPPPSLPLLLYGPTAMESVSGTSQSHLPVVPRKEKEEKLALLEGMWVLLGGGPEESWVEGGVG